MCAWVWMLLSWLHLFMENSQYDSISKLKQYLVNIQVHENKNVFSSEIILPQCLQRFLWVGNSSYEWAIFEMCYFSVNNQRDSMGMKSSQEVFGTCCCCCYCCCCCCCRAAALKQQSGKAERRMIFRCQNLRWRTNTRLRILHPHDQFKSLLECGV